MGRKDITDFLSDLLISDKLSGFGKYWSDEVSIDPWAEKGKPKRVDFMQFVPDNQYSVSAIEKGIFVCYEIKSCKEDMYSGNGLNFLGEKNHIVTTMECYKDILPDLNNGTFRKYLQETHPESSEHIGIMVAIPYMSEAVDEYEKPTPIDFEINKWKLAVVKPCNIGLRKKSMTELLFCMLRSGRGRSKNER